MGFRVSPGCSKHLSIPPSVGESKWSQLAFNSETVGPDLSLWRHAQPEQSRSHALCKLGMKRPSTPIQRHRAAPPHLQKAVMTMKSNVKSNPPPTGSTLSRMIFFSESLTILTQSVLSPNPEHHQRQYFSFSALWREGGVLHRITVFRVGKFPNRSRHLLHLFPQTSQVTTQNSLGTTFYGCKQIEGMAIKSRY